MFGFIHKKAIKKTLNKTHKKAYEKGWKECKRVKDLEIVELKKQIKKCNHYTKKVKKGHNLFKGDRDYFNTLSYNFDGIVTSFLEEIGYAVRNVKRKVNFISTKAHLSEKKDEKIEKRLNSNPLIYKNINGVSSRERKKF